ncbi:MAG: nucleoside recognition domain-containing protein [Anaerolineae bacterium]
MLPNIPIPKHSQPQDDSADQLLKQADSLRARLGEDLHDQVMESIYTEAAAISDAVTKRQQRQRFDLDRFLDRLLTSRLWGFPAMGLLFFGVFWLTITGANIPSALLSDLLLNRLYGGLHTVAAAISTPQWIVGLLIDGMYLTAAWVISVMLPPMAIFFPLFTLLEDFGYLPRVAFNLDRLFSGVGAHGKQSLTMLMGFGCNAAGVVATRIIDSPRERLIAIITNNFSVCNGRWPLLILMGTIFIGRSAPPVLASAVAAASVVGVALIGVFTTLLVSAFLSHSWLRGIPSAFSLELPPYRPPRLLQTLVTSLRDRTLIVLWRAILMAAPAGAVIWLVSNITINDTSIAGYLVNVLQPLGLLIGLNGIVLVAYIVAIPANEIVIPTILMLTLMLGHNLYGAQAGVLLSLNSDQIYTVLTDIGGWTLLTAVNLMLFSLLHNPCSTTILTIWNETKSLKWTTVATLLPLSLAFAVTALTSALAHLWHPV